MPHPWKNRRLFQKKLLHRLSHPDARINRLKDGIILGAKLARQLEAGIGDTVKLVSSEQRMTPIGDVPRIKKLEVIGIFESGISGYDEVLAFIDYRLLQKIYRMDDKITGLGVSIRDAGTAPEIAMELSEIGVEYVVSNWADENKSIFQVMKLEKNRSVSHSHTDHCCGCFQYHQFTDYAGFGKVQGNCNSQSFGCKRFQYPAHIFLSGISYRLAGNNQWSVGRFGYLLGNYDL